MGARGDRDNDAGFWAEVARHRAEGRDWEHAAKAVGRAPDELRRAALCSDEYEVARRRADAERDRDAVAAMMVAYRRLMNSSAEDIAIRAAEGVMRYCSAVRREQVRTEIERSRTLVAVEKARAAGAPVAPAAPAPSDAPRAAPPARHQPRAPEPAPAAVVVAPPPVKRVAPEG